MALPTAYLVTPRNLEAVLNAMANAKAPPKFTQRFLEELEFKSTNDRLYINVFKALGFLSEDGTPTSTYFEFLDQTQSARVLATAVEDAYADLFQIRRDAQNMDRGELRGKIKTLTQGQVSDKVVDKMAMTFLALAEQGDWDSVRTPQASPLSPSVDQVKLAGPAATPQADAPDADGRFHQAESLRLGGFVYNIELHLPESRDPAVYEVLFKALKTHLLA